MEEEEEEEWLEEQCGQNMAGDQQPVTEGEPHGADARAHVQVSV